MKGAARAVLLVAAISVALAGTSCRRQAAASTHIDAGVSLPVVIAEAEGFLFTWIDDKGDFHVETKVGDVPMMGRDMVRVERESGDAMTAPDQIVIVDLRQARTDGTYPVRTMSRADFEAVAVARREKTGPTLANAAPSAATGGAPPAAPVASGDVRHATSAVVVIYGAEWCGACHEAARYLRHKGIAYVEKDIEKDADAAREMQQKLSKNGLRGGSIPVIDVRGKVMVGFDPGQIDAALGAAL